MLKWNMDEMDEAENADLLVSELTVLVYINYLRKSVQSAISAFPPIHTKMEHG
ncbi:MAG TPA: hypothetical protein VK957_20570 [Lunatimonas sp.]|nr:hypothetical protein [Lunatimonas sp.]